MFPSASYSNRSSKHSIYDLYRSPYHELSDVESEIWNLGFTTNGASPYQLKCFITISRDSVVKDSIIFLPTMLNSDMWKISPPMAILLVKDVTRDALGHLSVLLTVIGHLGDLTPDSVAFLRVACNFEVTTMPNFFLSSSQHRLATIRTIFPAFFISDLSNQVIAPPAGIFAVLFIFIATDTMSYCAHFVYRYVKGWF